MRALRAEPNGHGSASAIQPRRQWSANRDGPSHDRDTRSRPCRCGDLLGAKDGGRGGRSGTEQERSDERSTPRPVGPGAVGHRVVGARRSCGPAPLRSTPLPRPRRPPHHRPVVAPCDRTIPRSGGRERPRGGRRRRHTRGRGGPGSGVPGARRRDPPEAPSLLSPPPQRAMTWHLPDGRDAGSWGRRGSNPRPSDYESPALTTELRPRVWRSYRSLGVGGSDLTCAR